MTDQADTGPIDLAGIRARWSRNGGMGNDRSDEDYTDAGCRILARAAFRDFPVLDAEVRALRAENANLADEITDLTEHTYPRTWGGFKAFIDEQYPQDVFGIGNTDGPAMVRAAHALTIAALERDALAAELAAARDRIAAVRAAIEDVATFIPHARNLPQIMDTSLYGAEITMRDRIAARLRAALSQSGQPTKGEPA